MRTYTIKSGDTLWKIARRYHVPLEALMTLNGITRPDQLQVGTCLQIPENSTDAMDAVGLPVEEPEPAPEPTRLEIDKNRFALPAKEFYPETTEKDLVVLHFTAGKTARSAYECWLANPTRVATAYIVDTDGKIYELFDPSYWAWHLGIGGNVCRHDKRSIGIEIANVGPLKKSPTAQTQLNWWFRDWSAPFCKLDQSDLYVQSSFRGVRYFASYPAVQMESVSRLTGHLCERFSIPRKLPPSARRGEHDANYFRKFRGVAAHQNFRSDKWDIGPAFDWDRLGI